MIPLTLKLLCLFCPQINQINFESLLGKYKCYHLKYYKLFSNDPSELQQIITFLLAELISKNFLIKSKSILSLIEDILLIFFKFIGVITFVIK